MRDLTAENFYQRYLTNHRNTMRKGIEDRRTVMAVPFRINSRLRYVQPQIGIDEHSTRTDVRARLPQIRKIKGIGPKSVQIIQAWLDESPVAIT